MFKDPCTLQAFFDLFDKDAIKVVYDVGAHQGDWTNEVSKLLNQDTKFYLFEPTVKHNSFLYRTGYPFYNILLSDSEKEVDFWSNGTTGDSIYKEIGTDAYNGVTPQKIKTEILEKFCIENNIEPPDLIKLDVQGAELDILKGSPKILLKAKIIMMECSIYEYNEGSPKIEEVLKFMSSCGFYPFYITQVRDKEQIDLAFSRQWWF